MIKNSPTISFVCYHYISRSDEFKRLYGHSLEVFKNHLKYFENNFNIISIEDLKDHLSGIKKLEGNCLILSFDDGLKEHSEIIAPILDKKKIKAVFSISGATLNKEPLNPQIIHCGMAVFGIRDFFNLFIKYGKELDLNEDLYLIEESEKKVLKDFYKKIKNKLKYKIPRKELRKVLLNIWNKELLEILPDSFEKIYMNLGEMKKLSEDGHTISLHSDTHPLINDSLFSEELFEEEIVYPKNKLENLISKRIACFSYPFASEKDILYNQQNLDKLNNLGIEFIFTIFKKSSRFDTNFVGRYSSQASDDIKDLKENIWKYEISDNN